MDRLITIDQGLDSGIWYDSAYAQVPLWVDGDNIVFRGGQARKMYGRTVVSTVPVNNDAIGLHHLLGSYYVAAPKATASTNYTIWKDGVDLGNTFALGGLDQWTFDSWGTWVLAATADRPLYVYKQTGQFVGLNVGGEFTKAKIVRTLGAHVLAFNTDVANGGRSVHWCTAGDAEDWVPTVGNSAGNVILRDSNSDITAVEVLDAGLLLYTDTEIYSCRYIGPPEIFSFRKVISDAGAEGPFSVVLFNNRHFFRRSDRQGYYMTDGRTLTRIDDTGLPYVKDASQAVVYIDDANEQVIFTHGGVETPYAYDYRRGVWVKQTESNSVGAVLRTGLGTGYAIAKRVGGVLSVVANSGQAGEDTNGIVASITTKPIQLHPQVGATWVDHIRVDATWAGASTAVVYEYALLNTPDATPTWSTPVAMTKDFAPLPVNGTGRWLQLRFSNNAVSPQWSIGRIEVYGNLNAESRQ